MKSTLKTLSAGALVLTALEHVHAQYAPPPPPTPFQGFLNEYLRAQDPYMNQWDFSGNLRLRYEKKDHLQIAGRAGSFDFRDHGADEFNDYFLGRLRFHAAYTDKWFSAYVEPQSSIVLSDERFAYANAPAIPGTFKRKENGPEADAIDLHQAYFTIGNHKEFPLSLKAGRQELSYGEERLVGAFGWNNIGRSFDAAKVRWQNPIFGVDFFSGYPVIPENGKFDVGNMPHDWFSGVYATSTKIPTTILDVYFFSRNADRQAIRAQPSPQFPQPSARDVYTVGGRLKSKPGELGDLDYSLEGAYQFGNFADPTKPALTAPRLTQNAFMVVAQAGYTFSDMWATPRLGAEFDYSSGDSKSTDSQHGTFDNLFPTNHKFYGSMDVVSLQNIQDLGLNLSLKPTPRMSVSFMGNMFWLANTHDFFYNVGGAPRTAAAGYGLHPNFNNFVGSEFTVVTGYALTRYAQVEAGYGHFFTGDFIDRSMAGFGGSSGADWLYTQLSVNF